MEKIPTIDKDIRKASTLPSSFYKDPGIFELCKEQIFSKCWHLLGDNDAVKAPGQIQPLTLLEGFLDEPILLTRDHNDALHCLSNVCTHRGNILVDGCTMDKAIKCRYHGRRFALDGSFQHMPEFEGAENFPSQKDNLPKLAKGLWGNFIFAALEPAFLFEELLHEMQQRVGWLPLNSFFYEPALSRDYLVHCNWALYCDNYLEGFHIPFIHPDLNNTLDYNSYKSEIYKYSNLQIGVAKKGEVCFNLPASSPDYGQSIAAYYFWLFPNMMFNFYPWGLSVNVVKPLTPDRCKVSFQSYIYDKSLLSKGSGAMLDKVEREDESVVEKVQRGVSSRLYESGRYSPNREQGVHHFHSLISQFLNRH